MKYVFFAIFALGGFLCAVNLYLSFVRYVLLRVARRPAEYRFESGIPMLGSLLVVACLASFQLPNWTWIPGIVLAVLDTGGIHWFVGTMAFRAVRSAMQPSRRS